MYKELIGDRTETTKTFDVGNGHFQLQSFGTKIHYKSGKNWLDVKSNIINIDDITYSYRNEANDFFVYAARNVIDGI